MTTVNQDYPTQRRESHSPRLAPIQDARSQASQGSHADAWTAAFQRLQDQVYHNATMIEEQRRHLADLHDAMKGMHSDIGSIWRHVDQCREQIEVRMGASRPERQDIDFLAQHLQNVERKASEVGNLRMQLDLMTQRVRRLEDSSTQLPGSAPHGHSQHASQHAYQQAAPQQQYPTPQPHGTPSTDHRAPAHPGQAEQQASHAGAPQHVESRTEGVYGSASTEVRSMPGFRALDPSAGVTSWRAASAHTTGQHTAVPHEAVSAARPEPATSTGWAAVNATSHAKRPASIDAGHPHDSSAPASPKRQKLATLMPRSSIGEGQAPHAPSQYTESAAPTAIKTDPSQPPYVAPSQQPPMRFIPFPPNAEAAAAQQESWRIEQAEAEAARVVAGRSRSRGGMRKSGSQGVDDSDARSQNGQNAHHEWSGSQDGYYRQAHHTYATSPQDGGRGRDSHPTGYTPEGHYAGETPSPAFQDSGKKSRTKPTRNANGVLIRKDGRPDMRSISSAQNLRKVHAKKEAERNGDTQNDPTSATSSNPTHNSLDDKSSVVDGSVTDSPITPTAEIQEKRGHVAQRGFASINDDRREHHYMRRDESHVSETQVEPRSDRSMSGDSQAYQAKSRKNDDAQMTDPVMLDKAGVQERHNQETVDMPQRVEPSAVAA